MNRVKPILYLLLLFFTAVSAFAQDDVFMLLFRHPAVGSCYVSAVYADDRVYLPVGELFSLLFIPVEKGKEGFSLKGAYPPANDWEINPDQFTARTGRKTVPLAAVDFRIGETDLYLASACFDRLFGIRVDVNLSTLQLSIQSRHPLPVEERQHRDRLRYERENSQSQRIGYPLLYPRNRQLAGGGMLDYAIGSDFSNAGESFNYNFTGAMEFLGGDLQGSARGIQSRGVNGMAAGNFRWRYALSDNPWLTAVRAGHLTTNGVQSRQIIGGAVTNDPVMPRRTYDAYVVEGHTVPDSEVELYTNYQLAGFAYADELGYYRFEIPLHYGSMRVGTRIYTPLGQIITEEKQLLIPFTFLPKGVVTYNVQGGVSTVGSGVSPEGETVLHGDAAWGIANGITVKAGVDYFHSDKLPLYSGSLSARLFDQCLLNIDFVPGAWHRANVSLNHPGNRSFSMVYTGYGREGRYNPMAAKWEVTSHVYLPVRFFGWSTGFRFGGEHRHFFSDSRTTSCNMDLHSRVGRTSLRMNYRGRLFGTANGGSSFGNRMATASAGYTFGFAGRLPLFMKGLFTRVQTIYNLGERELYGAGMQLSRTFLRCGRFQFDAGYGFVRKKMEWQATLLFDLPFSRSSSRIISRGGIYSLSQNFSGSLALDAGNNRLTAGNRNLAGQSAAAVRLFVDANNNGYYDRDEEVIPAGAVRLGQGAPMKLGKDGILRITQLQNFWHYQAIVLQTALPDPTLAPKVSAFSFVADPNRYKPIDIPLYRTGVIEGTVFRQTAQGESYGQGGLRLLLRGVDNACEETLRTFSDGGFYAMNLLPGKYTLEADPVQLNFLQAKSQPQKLEFEVKAIADGDFIEGLRIVLSGAD